MDKPTLFVPKFGLGNRFRTLFSFLGAPEEIRGDSKLLWIAVGSKGFTQDCNIKFNQMFKDIDGVLPYYDEVNVEKYKEDYNIKFTNNTVFSKYYYKAGAQRLEYNHEISEFIKGLDLEDLSSKTCLTIRILDKNIGRIKKRQCDAETKMYEKYTNRLLETIKEKELNNFAISTNFPPYQKYLEEIFNIPSVYNHLPSKNGRSDNTDQVEAFKKMIVISKCKNIINIAEGKSTFYTMARYLNHIKVEE